MRVALAWPGVRQAYAIQCPWALVQHAVPEKPNKNPRSAESIMLTIIVIAASFIGVAALVGGVAVMFRGDANQAIEDRLDVLAGLKTATLSRGVNEADSSLLSSPLDETRGMLERAFSRFGNIRKLLEQADAPLDASRFMLLSAGMAFGGAVDLPRRARHSQVAGSRSWRRSSA